MVRKVIKGGEDGWRKNKEGKMEMFVKILVYIGGYSFRERSDLVEVIYN